MAAISAILGGITAAAAVAGAATSLASAKKHKTPTFNPNAQKKKAAEQEAEANKRRIMSETDTIKTSALGNTGTTDVKKKTLLGG